MKRRLKIAALFFGAFLVSFVAFLAWVIYTEAGLQFAVARLPEKMGKVTLRIEDVEGTIAGGFSARYVDVDHELSRTQVTRGQARVNFWPLLVGRISVRNARADVVQVDVKPRPADRPKTPPKFMPRLLSISAERAFAKSLVIVAPNGRRVEFDDVSGAGIVGHKTIRIFEGNIIYGVLRARAIGLLRAADPTMMSGEATVRMIIEDQPEWLAEVSFDGDLDKLPLGGRLQAPFRADLEGELLELSSNFHWTGKARVYDFDLRDFGAGDALGLVSGDLRLGGEMNAFHARGPLRIPGLGAGLFDVVFEGYYEDRVVTSTHYEVTHRATGSHADGAGTIEPVDGGPKLALAGQWRDLKWPLAARFTEEAPLLFGSPAGDYRLEGVWPYAISGSGALEVPELDPMTVDLRGALHKEQLRIDALTLQAFDGQAQLAGDARWNPGESWQLEGDVRGFNPGRLRKGLDGALDFQLAASGAPFGSENLDLSFRNVSGRLRGMPATGTGHVIKRGENWEFDSVRMRAGTTRVALDGSIGPTRPLDLEFGIETENLALLAEGARGRLRADGILSGSSRTPVVRLNGSGTDIEYGDLRVDRIRADIDLDWRGQTPSRADIAISRLALAERVLTQFNATLDGTTNDHDFKIDALATQTTLHVAGKGAFSGSVWHGTIADLFIDDAANVNLRLDKPVSVMASASNFRMSPLCLRGKVAELCGEAAWSEAAWSASAQARNLPISSLTAGLTPRVEYQGTINANASIGAQGGGPLVGEARADLVDAAIRHRLASGRTDVISFGSGFVTLNADPERMTGEVRLDAAARGTIFGRMRAERVSPDVADWPLQGQLQMATGELGFVTLYVPDIDRASGQFDTNISFEGTLGRPVASGIVKFSRGELDLYQVNLALRAVEMEARVVANNLEFSSTARAGAGTLSSSGKIEWREGLPYGEFRLDGENLRLVDVPEARIDASPDLVFRIAGRDIMVSGEVNVPRARIEPADLTTAVLPSADEVMVGETEEVEREPFRVSSEITLSLGDEVSIDTYGLTGHITGSITERTRPGEPTRANGELQVRDGQYMALARKLDIERGRLMFNGLLVDPAVDIRAVKEFPDIKAGVNVRGTLREPRLSFFSEPSVPQSQIVSLLLAGGGLQSAQDQSRAGTPAGRQEVAGQAAALLASQLGSKLGIPDISVESDLSNETSLVLGKYLSPRLYVSWGVSLSEAINTFKMRYTVNDRWTMRTEAGKERSADLVYTIEK